MCVGRRYWTGLATPRRASILHAVEEKIDDRRDQGFALRRFAYYAREMTQGSLREDDPARAGALTISLCMGLGQQRLLWTAEPVTEDPASGWAENVAETLAELYAIPLG